jgi:hypothetical protein
LTPSTVSSFKLATLRLADSGNILESTRVDQSCRSRERVVCSRAEARKQVGNGLDIERSAPVPEVDLVTDHVVDGGANDRAVGSTRILRPT